MNRNVSIVIIILVLAVVAFYLVWIRNKYQPSIAPRVEQDMQIVVTPTPNPTSVASPSAKPKESTASTKQKVSTNSAVKK